MSEIQEQVTEENIDAAPEKDEVLGQSELKENPNLRWYVIHAYSGFEQKAKTALLQKIEQNGMEKHFGQIFIPKTVSERTLKSGKKKKVEKTSYPGYLLAQIEMNDQTKLVVRQTPKITGFVGNAVDPRPISDSEVLRLTSPDVARAMEAPEKLAVKYVKGEAVKVTDGAFANFDGVIDEVRPEKSKVLVLVTIFGRETPVELDYTQIKKLK